MTAHFLTAETKQDQGLYSVRKVYPDEFIVFVKILEP